MALHGCCGRIIFHGGVAIELARSEACAAGDRDTFFLFLHQALHQLVSSLSRIRAGYLSGGSVDRHYWAPRSVHADLMRRGCAVGVRALRALRLIGVRVSQS